MGRHRMYIETVPGFGRGWNHAWISTGRYSISNRVCSDGNIDSDTNIVSNCLIKGHCNLAHAIFAYYNAGGCQWHGFTHHVFQHGFRMQAKFSSYEIMAGDLAYIYWNHNQILSQNTWVIAMFWYDYRVPFPGRIFSMSQHHGAIYRISIYSCAPPLTLWMHEVPLPTYNVYVYRCDVLNHGEVISNQGCSSRISQLITRDLFLKVIMLSHPAMRLMIAQTDPDQ